MGKVFVFGSLNMDLVINSPYLPKKGETMYGSGFMTNPGGKGANQAAAAGKLGAEIYMGGAVGDDSFGTQLLDNLRGFGVNVDAVRVVENCATGIAVIVVIDGDNRIILDGGANRRVTPADVDRLLENAGAGDIFLCPLENPILVLGYALETASRKGMYVVLNPAPMNPEIVPYLPCVDMLIPNETEFAALCGDKLTEGPEKLIAMGVKDVVVTLGSKGYCYISKGEMVCEDCIKVPVVDTTAAGDTFCGALCTELSMGKSVPQALSFANRAAAVAVTRKGAQSAIPTRAEVQA